MQKLRDYWMARSRQQRLTLIAAFALTFLAVAGFSWIAGRAPMALLYGGLAPSEAGNVVAEVERRNVAYEVRGEAIWVDARQRDRLRMDLASVGLPAAGGSGYELLDGMSGFGTTSQMFDAAYWRAKEGELARTILALPSIRAARVHLAVPTGRGYRRDSPGAASVTLTTNGTVVSREQARSLQFLVSSGVPGIAPEAVTVIDSARGVISPDEERMGRDREAEMKRNVERILEPHVGAGNAIVELHLELENDSEQTTEKRFDPRERALISQEVEETSDNNTNQAAGPVTAASNLPDGPGKGSDQSQSNRSETRQRSNYEVSQVTREVVRQPGATRRLTVAVLVNGTVQEAPDGASQIVPRSEAELTAIRELASSAVGFDEARGDQLTVKSLPFADMTGAGTLAERPGWADRLALDALARLGMIGIFALAIAALILRPALKARLAAAVAPAAVAKLTAPAAEGDLPVLAMASPMGGMNFPMAMPLGEANLPQMLTMATPAFSFDPPGKSASAAVERLREMMRERHDESVKILSNWITEPEETLR